MTVYLHLFHGRNSPDEDLDDWGFNGPTIGPLRYVHTTYASHLKFEFLEDEAAAKFGLDPEEGELRIVDDMVVYDGKYFGDWSVSAEKATGHYQTMAGGVASQYLHLTHHEALDLFEAMCTVTEQDVQLFDVSGGQCVLVKERCRSERRNYDVIVTRDTTESCAMVVEAATEDEAREHAAERAQSDPDLVWTQDDTPNASADPYVTHCEEAV